MQAVDTQAVTDELPLGEVEPAGQVIHALAPTPAAYAPTWQFVQTVGLLAPVTPEYVPAEHPVHALADTAVEYDPGAQFVQLPPVTYVPAAQPDDTAVHALAPAVDVLPTGQEMQLVELLGFEQYGAHSQQ